MFHPEGPSFLELVRQALSSTDRGYDLLAPKFDHTPFRTPDPILEDAIGRAAAAAPIRRALDVCCGTGAATRVLARHASERIVGIDRSAGMLLEARRRLRDAPGHAKIALGRGDALAMPFEGVFDLAVSFGAFGHILERDEPDFVLAIHRALAPGGRFVFVTGEMPPLAHPGRWVAHGFNFAMRVRNALIDPPFVMYYLTFLLPGVKYLLEGAGFDVAVHGDAFPPPLAAVKLVVATKRARR